ncbi:MAG: hypothetical protein OEV92_09440, partial [Nitrospinota bacterium]|nr:hypothetical protein [Nitrospinota bacterium]
MKIKDNLGEFHIYLRKDRSLARLRLVDDGKFEEPERLNDPWPKSQWSFVCDHLNGGNTPAVLLRPWSWLSSPRRLDRKTARQAAGLIALTYPSTGAGPSLPPIQPPAADKRKLPTAARPRGVRKHSPPPKLKPPPALDLRPYLASQAGTEYLLRLMDELGDGAMNLQTLSLPKSTPDIFYSRLFPFAVDSAAAGKLYKTAMALRLENDEPALAAFCSIIVRRGVEFACRWSAPAQYLDKIGITGWLAMLAQLAPRWRADALPPAQLAGFMKKNGGAITPWQAWFIIGSLRREASFDQIQQGYYLAEKMFPEYRLSPIGPRPGIDPEFIHYLGRKSGVLEDHLAFALWQHGGELAGFADLLISFDWGNINKDAAKELLQGLIWRSYPWNVFYRPGVYDAVFNHRPYLAHGLRRL